VLGGKENSFAWSVLSISFSRSANWWSQVIFRFLTPLIAEGYSQIKFGIESNFALRSLWFCVCAPFFANKWVYWFEKG